jgi:hypothetical protein
MNTTVTGTPFNWDKLIAGDFPTAADRVQLASGQGILARGTALGASRLTIGAAVAGTHAGTETIAQPTLQAGAMAGVYKLICTAVNAGVGTFAVFNPQGERLGDAVQAVAYANQIGFTIAGGAAVAGDTYSITVSDAITGKAVSDIAEGINGGVATLTAASALATAIVGEYVLTCTAVNAGVGTYSVVDPQGNALANATQAVAYNTELSFTIGGGAPEVGDSFVITVSPATLNYVVCNEAAVDGSQTLACILADDGVDTTAAIYAAVYTTGKFNGAAVTFAAGDSYANHIGDKATIMFTAIHP